MVPQCSKRWIGNATFAGIPASHLRAGDLVLTLRPHFGCCLLVLILDVIVVWARNQENGTINGFLVEKGTKGLKTKKIENKMCLRCVQKYVPCRHLDFPSH